MCRLVDHLVDSSNLNASSHGTDILESDEFNAVESVNDELCHWDATNQSLQQARHEVAATVTMTKQTTKMYPSVGLQLRFSERRKGIQCFSNLSADALTSL